MFTGLNACVLLVLGTLLLGTLGCSEPAPPRTPPVGVALGLYPRAEGEHSVTWPPPVEEIAALGARTAWLPVTWRQAELSGTTIGPDEDSISDGELEVVIDRARSAGLEVILCPLLEVRSEDPFAWRGRIGSEHAGSAWWASYTAFVSHYARIAARSGAGGLVVSDEMNWLSSPETLNRWRALVAQVRRLFSGELIAVVNHDALERAVLPWGAFDRIGVSAYFPLAGSSDASQAELDAGWERAADALTAFSARVGRPIFIAEVGYPSVDGAAVAPWQPTSTRAIDLEEQAGAFLALERALPRMPAVEGVVIWAWLGPGGDGDRWYTPRAKPAEPVVRRILARFADRVR